eukprot:jgi/Hompol1/6378/HPOL_002260-RA
MREKRRSYVFSNEVVTSDEEADDGSHSQHYDHDDHHDQQQDDALTRMARSVSSGGNTGAMLQRMAEFDQDGATAAAAYKSKTKALGKRVYSFLSKSIAKTSSRRQDDTAQPAAVSSLLAASMGAQAAGARVSHDSAGISGNSSSSLASTGQATVIPAPVTTQKGLFGIKLSKLGKQRNKPKKNQQQQQQEQQQQQQQQSQGPQQLSAASLAATLAAAKISAQPESSSPVAHSFESSLTFSRMSSEISVDTASTVSIVHLDDNSMLDFDSTGFGHSAPSIYNRTDQAQPLEERIRRLLARYAVRLILRIRFYHFRFLYP